MTTTTIDIALARWSLKADFWECLERANKFLGATNLFGTSSKIAKENGEKFWNMVIYLPPADSGGLGDLCVGRTPGCTKSCLGIGSGRMRFDKKTLETRDFDWDQSPVQQAQIKRLTLFRTDRPAFRARMVYELVRHVRKANRDGILAAARLNGTSDIVWERVFPEVFKMFPEVQFYDYTKLALRTRRFAPVNYHLTFSYADGQENHDKAEEWLAAGRNVAVVFDTRKDEKLPDFFKGRPVIDADKHDRRFEDAPGTIPGLRAKGAAIGDTSGFVVQTQNNPFVEFVAAA